MDLGFAAGPEADGDWGDEDAPVEVSMLDEPAEPAPAGRPSRSRSRSPQPRPQELPPQLSLADAAPAPRQVGSVTDGLYAPKSKIHSNPRTKYFVIKSNNHKNLVLSVENNVWATQRKNEATFDEAMRDAPHVILLFSVNMSGCFQGYAKMVGRTGTSKKPDVFNGFGRPFDIRWLRLGDLEVADIAHISNPLNDNLPVKMSRDGQELPFEIGAQLCDMVDQLVYRSDPGNYVSDEHEAETGGFGPPAASARGAPPVHTQVPHHNTGAPMHSLAGAGGVPTPGWPGHLGAPGGPPAAPPPYGAWGPPGMPWGHPPYGAWGPMPGGNPGVPAVGSAWGLPVGGAAPYAESSYYSDSSDSSSSSSSSSEDDKKAAPLVEKSTGAPLLPELPRPAEVPVPALAEVSRKEPSKKQSKKEKASKRHHEASGLPVAINAPEVVAENPQNKRRDREKKHKKTSDKEPKPGKEAKTAGDETRSQKRRHEVTATGGANNKKEKRSKEAHDGKHSDKKQHRAHGQKAAGTKDDHRAHRRSRHGGEVAGVGQAHVPDHWLGAAPAHPHAAAPPPHMHGAPPGWPGYVHGHHPGHHHPRVTLTPAAAPRAPPMDWHGACPVR